MLLKHRIKQYEGPLLNLRVTQSRAVFLQMKCAAALQLVMAELVQPFNPQPQKHHAKSHVMGWSWVLQELIIQVMG